MTYVLEALELEDTIKNYERRKATGWSVLNLLLLKICDIFDSVSSVTSFHLARLSSLLFKFLIKRFLAYNRY